jgi:hypothetical protein
VYDAELIRELLKLSGEKVRKTDRNEPPQCLIRVATVQQQHLRVVLPKGTLDRVFAAMEVEVRGREHVETLLLEHRLQRLAITVPRYVTLGAKISKLGSPLFIDISSGVNCTMYGERKIVACKSVFRSQKNKTTLSCVTCFRSQQLISYQ